MWPAGRQLGHAVIGIKPFKAQWQLYIPRVLAINNSAVFLVILDLNSCCSLNSINDLIFVMMKCCVFFEVQTKHLNNYLDELRLQGRKLIFYCSKWRK
jgi:hypothetical protein